MHDTQYPFFLYGTLRPNELRWDMIEQVVERVQGGEVEGKLYNTGEYPFYSPGGGIVKGEWAWIEEKYYAVAIILMDRVERYDPLNQEGSLFIRELITDISGTVTGYIYKGNDFMLQLGCPQIASGDWKQRKLGNTRKMGAWK